MQETKLSDAGFTKLVGADLAARGYDFAHAGHGRRNGVAILSRVGLDNVASGMLALPGSEDRSVAVAATCAGMRVQSVYVPNSRGPLSQNYHYRLEWLAALQIRSRPDRPAWCSAAI